MQLGICTGLLSKHKPPLTPMYREVITFLNGMLH